MCDVCSLTLQPAPVFFLCWLSSKDIQTVSWKSMLKSQGNLVCATKFSFLIRGQATFCIWFESEIQRNAS